MMILKLKTNMGIQGKTLKDLQTQELPTSCWYGKGYQWIVNNQFQEIQQRWKENSEIWYSRDVNMQDSLERSCHLARTSNIRMKLDQHYDHYQVRKLQRIDEISTKIWQGAEEE